MSSNARALWTIDDRVSVIDGSQWKPGRKRDLREQDGGMGELWRGGRENVPRPRMGPHTYPKERRERRK